MKTCKKISTGEIFEYDSVNISPELKIGTLYYKLKRIDEYFKAPIPHAL